MTMSDPHESQPQTVDVPKPSPSAPVEPISQNTAINPDTPLFSTPKMDAAIKEAQNEANER
jgi:hypothetical protein